MDNQPDVTPDPSTGTIGRQPEPAHEVIAENPQPQKPPKGFVPYQALEEERSKRKELEERLNNLSAPSAELDETYSDEGKELRGEIKSLHDKLRSIERRETRREVESEYPALRDKKEDFDAFLEDEENKRLSVRKAATLFLAEQNLLASEPPARMGLEKPTGGGSVPPEPKLSPEDIRKLMQTDWRTYEKLVREGKI